MDDFESDSISPGKEAATTNGGTFGGVEQLKAITSV